MMKSSKISVFVSKYFPFSSQQGVWTIAFVISLALTLCEDSYLWLARIGWILLAILFSLHRRYAIYSIFFFAAFFCSAGFLRHAPMSVKHFHMACTLLIMIDLLRGMFFSGLKRAGVLPSNPPLIIVLALSCAISLRYGFKMQNFRTPLNVGLVLMFLNYLYSCVAAFEPEERAAVLRRCLLALCSGMAIQVLMAMVNNFIGGSRLEMPLFHNNHLGNLSLFAFFYALPLFTSSKKSFGKFIYFIMLLIIFAGIVASCSRTAWLSCFFGFSIFSVLSWRFLKKNIGQCAFYTHILPTIVLLIVVFFLMMLKSDSVMSRVLGLQQLFDIEYWRFTFSDRQNFGFLGIFRLEQYLFLKEILLHHWLLGVGFSKQVVDMHGLHLVILGATGVAGFSFFLAFCVRHLLRIYRAISCQANEELLLFLAGSFSSFAAWMIMSFMETFIVHFIVWVNVMLGVLLVALSYDLQKQPPDDPPMPC